MQLRSVDIVTATVNQRNSTGYYEVADDIAIAIAGDNPPNSTGTH